MIKTYVNFSHKKYHTLLTNEKIPPNHIPKRTKGVDNDKQEPIRPCLRTNNNVSINIFKIQTKIHTYSTSGRINLIFRPKTPAHMLRNHLDQQTNTTGPQLASSRSNAAPPQPTYLTHMNRRDARQHLKAPQRATTATPQAIL